MSKLTYRLPCFGINVECDPKAGTGTIQSDLPTGGTVGTKDANPTLNAAMGAIESLILAHAVAGVDICSPAYIEGIETAVEKVSNYYD